MMEESHIHKGLVVTEAVDVIAGNSDILSEILLRLPARSLIRFTLVCKHWCSIITSQQFRLSHCHLPPYSSALLPSGLYFYDVDVPEKIESLPFAENVTGLPPLPLLDLTAELKVMQVKALRVQVTQSCNGLLMCEIYCNADVGYIRRGVVYNPAKKEYRLLPCPSSEYVHYYVVFDPLEPPYYKVFCTKLLDAPHFGGDVDVSVYVPGSESWRFCFRFTLPSQMRYGRGVFCNGAIHLVGEYISIHVDVNSEEVITREFPPSLCKSFHVEAVRYFGESGGHLHLIRVQRGRAKKFNVLELDKGTGNWSAKYRVDLDLLRLKFPEMGLYAFSIVSVIRGENEEDSVLLLIIPGKVVAYNLFHKTAKVLHKLSGVVGEAVHHNFMKAYPYTESLSPV